MNDEILGDEWDLGEVLTERAQPTETVTIYLNEVASYEKGKLLEAQSKATPEEVTEIDTALSKVEAELENSKFIIHLTALPSRMREDIASKALHEFPIQRDFMGQDNPINQLNRMKKEQNLLWHAQVTNVVNPLGKSRRAWTYEQMEKFSESIPTAAQRAVDAALLDLTNRAEQYTVASKSADF